MSAIWQYHLLVPSCCHIQHLLKAIRMGRLVQRCTGMALRASVEMEMVRALGAEAA